MQTFPCASCGAELHFQAGTEALVCGYCGDKQLIQAKPESKIREYDFSQALYHLKQISPAQLIKNASSIRCDSCGAQCITAEQADHCAFCGSSMIIALATAESIILPESVLPFQINQNQAKEQLRIWIRQRWFAPNNLQKKAQFLGVTGVYLPYWSYDSQTTTKYTGKRGKETGSGKSRKIRWSLVAGMVQVSFDDVLVCASHSLPQKLIDRVEPWDLPALRAYDPAYLSGFVAERYQIGLEDGFPTAHEKMQSQIRTVIQQDIGGDAQQIITMEIQHAEVKFKHFLLPLWISSFRYRDKIFRIIVNARTGEVSGERPWSISKIACLVISMVMLIAVIIFVKNSFVG